MNITKIVNTMDKHKKCKSCGSEELGANQGNIKIENMELIRTCACGWSITVDLNKIKNENEF